MPNTRSCIRHCLKYNLIFAEFKFNWLAGCPVCWPANPVTLVDGDHDQAAGELWDAQPATRRCRVWSRRESQGTGRRKMRSEEHTSELQSPCNLVCRLLLE